MKLLNKKITIFILFLTAAFGIKAQSVESYSQDTCIATNVNTYNNMLKYFMAEDYQVKQIFKTDIMQLAQKRLNLWYEHSLNEKISYELGTEILIPNLSTSTTLHSFDMSYHFIALNTNLKIWTTTNNNKAFSGRYFVFGANALIFHFKKNSYIDILNNGTIGTRGYYDFIIGNSVDDTKSGVQFRTNKYDLGESRLMLNCGYGFQKRLGRIAYIAAEAKFGVGTNKKLTNLYLMPELNFKAGFALSSLKHKNK